MLSLAAPGSELAAASQGARRIPAGSSTGAQQRELAAFAAAIELERKVG